MYAADCLMKYVAKEFIIIREEFREFSQIIDWSSNF